jgi:hypothetical protein
MSPTIQTKSFDNIRYFLIKIITFINIITILFIITNFIDEMIWIQYFLNICMVFYILRF